MATKTAKARRRSVLVRMAGVTAGLALLTAGTVTQAQASTTAGYIGDGYANNTHGVWCVQHLLNDIAYDHGYGRPLAEDGHWGPDTRSWVMWYQRTAPSLFNLTVDGIVGKGTGGYLLLEGDDYYGGNNYCYTYVPSRF
ncbi:peptidoglycan-binding domain-containing protein [Streptomyces sp. NPDC056231]|uniref:peptidoglycan-binding domain-containing protein n=1 Tax=Streptomyces sp. NPDC056231 TaxID=3345755 RepID=UPI003AAC3F71